MSREIQDTLEAYLEHKEFYSFEGPRGVDRFTTVAREIGYDSLEHFLEDNPGCIQAMIEWIGQQQQPDWLASLAVEVPQVDGEDEK